MLRGNIHFQQLQDALDPPFEVTSKTLWMLRCNIRFNRFNQQRFHPPVPPTPKCPMSPGQTLKG